MAAKRTETAPRSRLQFFFLWKVYGKFMESCLLEEEAEVLVFVESKVINGVL